MFEINPSFVKKTGTLAVALTASLHISSAAFAADSGLFPSLSRTTNTASASGLNISTGNSTTTSTTVTETQLRPPAPMEQTVQRSVDITSAEPELPEKMRIDIRLAKKMAKDQWLEKAVEANPVLINAITQYPSAANILAKHPRIATIAAADHYTCRDITRWKNASRSLARNPSVKAVIDFDPEGIYRAIKRDSKIGKLLVKCPDFSQMIVDNPDLGKLLAAHM